MKHFLFATIFVAISFFAKAQYVTIPDANFRLVLMNNYPSCFNTSQMMDTTCSEIVNAVSLDATFPVSNWDGLQYLDNLQELNVESGSAPLALPATLKKFIYHNATTLPPFPNGLLYLDISSCVLNVWPSLPNSLEHLDVNASLDLPTPTSLPTSLKFFNSTDNFLFGSLPSLPAGLDTLICFGNNLSSLPGLPSTLKVLDCGNNNLTSIPALPVGLKRLSTDGNQTLTSLPALPSSLEYIAARNNQLASLPSPLPSSLVTLYIYGGNSIPSLPALPASLQSIICNGNPIAIMPALPAGLKHLECTSCQLTSLPNLPAGLDYLGCGNNHITALPTLPPILTGLDCESNSLTSIPELPAILTSLRCGSNQITSLPTLPPLLQYLSCSHTPIYFLPEITSTVLTTIEVLDCPNLYCLPVLPQTTGSFDVYMDNRIGCIPNGPSNVQLMISDSLNIQMPIYVNASQYPLCSAVNNSHHCNAFPLMTGYAYYDNNNNLVHDANEPVRANVRIDLSDGSYTFTNSYGYYQIAAHNIGACSVTVALPVYFTSVPLQYNFNFNTYDTLVTGNDFAFHAIASADSLAVHITPVNGAARPGFSYPYQISYENDGTTTINPNISFNYDNNKLIYDSSSNISVINTGSSLTLSELGFVAGMQKNLIGYFRVNSSAVIGDSLRAGVHINAGVVGTSDSSVVAIRGSFDPNDKSATPKLSTTQVNNGDYIYYSIRFQNTGTDTAFNVVVTDTLDAKLQPSTMQMIATSHPCKTTVKGNTISFEFINILLPDSNANQLKSHGYISFRIKPLNTLVVNDNVPNKAFIYFDYNNPVVTNSAVTTIVDPIVVPLKLLSFSVSRGTGSNANLYWSTNDELNVKNYTTEMSTNGRAFNAVGFENAKGYQYNVYSKIISIPSSNILYFRLKMNDIDGDYSYSNIAILKSDSETNAFNFLNNPVKDELSISLQDESLKNTTATIFNSQGVKVRTILLQYDVENINIRSLPAGTYYLVTEKGSRRFVVIK